MGYASIVDGPALIFLHLIFFPSPPLLRLCPAASKDEATGERSRVGPALAALPTLISLPYPFPLHLSIFHFWIVLYPHALRAWVLLTDHARPSDRLLSFYSSRAPVACSWRSSQAEIRPFLGPLNYYLLRPNAQLSQHGLLSTTPIHSCFGGKKVQRRPKPQAQRRQQKLGL